MSTNLITEKTLEDVKLASAKARDDILKGGSKMNGGYKDETSALSDNLDKGKQTFEEKLEALKNEYFELKESQKAFFSKDKFIESMNKCGTTLKGGLKKSADTVGEGVQKKPLGSLMVASTVGVLAGLLLSKKGKQKDN